MKKIKLHWYVMKSNFLGQISIWAKQFYRYVLNAYAISYSRQIILESDNELEIAKEMVVEGRKHKKRTTMKKSKPKK